MKSLLNDCHSLFDCIELSIKNKAKREAAASVAVSAVESNETSKEESSSEKFELQIANLEAENRVLLAQIATFAQQKQQDNSTRVESVTITTSLSESVSSEVVDLRQKLESSERLVESLRDQAKDLGVKLAEMTGLYETAKQAELDEKNKIKHLDRSIRALKIEKGTCFFRILISDCE
jgi:hypothetical protein